MMEEVPTAALQELQQNSDEALSTLAEMLDERPGMVQLLQEITGAEDLLTTVAELGAEEPEATRIMLHAGITALLSLHGNLAATAELHRRAESN